MNVQEAYNDWAQSYDTDANATRDLDQVVLSRALGTVHFASIIEAGCGTGKNTELLSRIGGSVVALDFSEGMLAQAKAKLGHLKNVTFAAADLTERWPCADHSATLVTCNLVLEHVPDLTPVLAEAARTLLDGGSLIICELHPFRQYEGTLATFTRGETKKEIPGFVHHISDYLGAARNAGFDLRFLQEWWHAKDTSKPPRLVSFLFTRQARPETAALLLDTAGRRVESGAVVRVLMDFIKHLWLPILLSAFAVWFWAILSCAILTLHKKDWSQLPSEEAFGAAVRPLNLPHGVYGFPYCAHPKQMREAEFMEKWKRGPTGLLYIGIPSRAWADHGGDIRRVCGGVVSAGLRGLRGDAACDAQQGVSSDGGNGRGGVWILVPAEHDLVPIDRAGEGDGYC